MMDEFEDYRGTTIKKGKLVAYNQSGDVVLGRVISIKMKASRNKWIPYDYLILIEKIGAVDRQGNPIYESSKVRNHKCIVGIEEVELSVLE